MVSLANIAVVDKAFNALAKRNGGNDIGKILFYWNASELNEGGDKIICYPGQNERRSQGQEGSKVIIDKREFLA